LNPTLGDPLQLADTSSAIFLREDQTWKINNIWLKIM
jgi:hypothetical protein